MDSSLPSFAVQDVLDAFHGRYTTIAGIALLFYDTILILGDEVRFSIILEVGDEK
jgi:hypothetical protein